MVVAPGGREFPALGMLFMSLRRSKEYKGKGRLGVNKFFILMPQSFSPVELC